MQKRTGVTRWRLLRNFVKGWFAWRIGIRDIESPLFLPKKHPELLPHNEEETKDNQITTIPIDTNKLGLIVDFGRLSTQKFEPLDRPYTAPKSTISHLPTLSPYRRPKTTNPLAELRMHFKLDNLSDSPRGSEYPSRIQKKMSITEEQFQEMTESLVNSIAVSPLMYHTAIDVNLPEYGCKNYVSDILNFWLSLAERKHQEEEAYKHRVELMLGNAEYQDWLMRFEQNKPKWKLLYEGVLLAQARLKLSDSHKPPRIVIPRPQIKR